MASIPCAANDNGLCPVPVDAVLVTDGSRLSVVPGDVAAAMLSDTDQPEATELEGWYPDRSYDDLVSLVRAATSRGQAQSSSDDMGTGGAAEAARDEYSQASTSRAVAAVRALEASLPPKPGVILKCSPCGHVWAVSR